MSKLKSTAEDEKAAREYTDSVDREGRSVGRLLDEAFLAGIALERDKASEVVNFAETILKMPDNGFARGALRSAIVDYRARREIDGQQITTSAGSTATLESKAKAPETQCSHDGKNWVQAYPGSTAWECARYFRLYKGATDGE